MDELERRTAEEQAASREHERFMAEVFEPAKAERAQAIARAEEAFAAVERERVVREKALQDVRARLAPVRARALGHVPG